MGRTEAQEKPKEPSQAVVPVAAKPAVPVDARVGKAQEWIGRALLLRGFYAGTELEYDATGKLVNGRLEGAPGTVDWTLAGMNVEAVSEAAGEVELDGKRVAIRYNQDAHTFDRHPLKGERLRIRLAEPATPAATATALAAIFSTGIDPALQRSMPDPWRHYFEPGLDWGKDALAGSEILKGNLPVNVVAPADQNKVDPAYPVAARQDRVEGTVTLRVTVDTEGVPRRITIARPLGYGMDLAAAEAVARWRFTPGMRDGKPVAVEILINQPFTLAQH